MNLWKLTKNKNIYLQNTKVNTNSARKLALARHAHNMHTNTPLTEAVVTSTSVVFLFCQYTPMHIPRYIKCPIVKNIGMIYTQKKLQFKVKLIKKLKLKN